MHALLVIALLGTAEDSRQLGPEVSAGVGVGGAAYSFPGGRWGDSLVMPYVLGRAVLGPVVGELEVLVAAPVASGGATTSYGVLPRLGWTARSWSLLAGASLQIAPSSAVPLQIVPSLRLRKNFTEGFGLSVGLFDLHGQAPFHLSAELGAFDIGYVAPLGLTAGARFSLPWAGLTVQARSLVFRIATAEFALVTLGVAWGGES